MLTPQYLDNIPDSIVELYADTEIKIIEDMVRRIAKTLKISDSTAYQAERLLAIHATKQYIIEQLSSRLNMSQNELKKLFEDAGTETLAYDDEIYKEWGLTPKNINSSPDLLQILNAGIKKTNGTFKNLTKTTANTATKQFENALDKAYNEILSGAFTYQDSMKRAVKGLTSNGISVIKYPTKHVDYMDVAIRRAMLTGVNQTACELQNERAEQMGSDLVETSSHAGARPSHAEWQGKVFSRSGKSEKYPDFITSTGYGKGAGLGGWNCRHNFYPVREGDTTSRTREELDKLNSQTVKYKDADGNWKTMSRYDATQNQRYFERQIRKYKRESAGLEAAEQDSSHAKAKIREWQKRQRDFTNQTGLRRDYFRERAGKQNNIKAVNNAAKDLGTRSIPFNENATFKVNIPGYNEDVNLSISNACKHVVVQGTSDGNEHLVLVNTATGKWDYEEIGESSSVGGDKFFEFLDKHLNEKFSFVHNHSSGRTFSQIDLNTYFKENNISSFIASGNNGKVRIIYGEKKKLKSADVVNEILDNDNIILKDLRKELKDGKIDTVDYVKLKDDTCIKYIIDNYCEYQEVDT